MFNMNELIATLAEQQKMSSKELANELAEQQTNAHREHTEQLMIMFKKNSKEITSVVVKALNKIEATFKQSLGIGNQKGSDEFPSSSSTHGQNAH